MIRKLAFAITAAAAIATGAPALAAEKAVGNFVVSNQDNSCSAMTDGDTGLLMIFAPTPGTKGGAFGFSVTGQTGLQEGMVPIQLGIGDQRFDFTADYTNSQGGFGTYLIPMDSADASDLIGGFPESWPFTVYRDGKRIFSAMVTPNSALTAELNACMRKEGSWR